MQNRSNRNESRRPYSSQGSYSSRGESRWSGGNGNRNSNFSSYNEDENARDYNMDGNSSSRREWDYEGGTHRSQGRGNRNENRYGSERYNTNEDRYANNWQATSDYDTGRNTSRDFNMRDREEHMDQDRYGRTGGYFSNTGRGNYGRNYESSRFNEDRESDSSPSYGSSRGDYSSQNYSDRDYRGSQSYSGRGDHLQESNYGYGQNSRGGSRSSSFEGRGPKSYTRSDDRIKEDICDMLTRHPEIDANDIEVEVKSGEVTLSGAVSERRMKHMAEDLVERISAVKEVINNIRVQRESTHDWSSTERDSDSADLSASSKGGSTGKRGSASQSTSSSTGTTQNPNH